MVWSAMTTNKLLITNTNNLTAKLNKINEVENLRLNLYYHLTY